MSAGEKTGQKRPSAPAGFGTADPAVSIGRQLFLVPFELGVNMTFVVAFEHNPATDERLAMAVGLGRTSIDNRGALLTFSKRKPQLRGAQFDWESEIERVFKNGYDVAIADRCPIESNHPLSV